MAWASGFGELVWPFELEVRGLAFEVGGCGPLFEAAGIKAWASGPGAGQG